jgi:phenylpropionate dioxygenase-like ring-hydroxylating dioxygenase large terminal subunit
LDKKSLGLVKAQVGVRHGAIFASFDPVVPTFEDYLGGLLPYFDAVHDWSGDGVELESWPFLARTVQPGNWKLLADQNSGDGYHVFTQHAATFELFADRFMLASQGGPRVDMSSIHTVSFPEGHSSSTFSFAASSPKPSPSAANPLAGRVGGYTMFPNFSTAIDISGNNAGPAPVPTFSINQVQPRGPAFMEVWGLGLVDKSAPEEEKAKIRRAANQVLATGGVDDQLSWVSVSQMAQGAMGRRQPLRYFNQVGSSPKPDGWPVSGGEFHTGRMSPDDGQWNFWMAWFNALTADES